MKSRRKVGDVHHNSGIKDPKQRPYATPSSPHSHPPNPNSRTYPPVSEAVTLSKFLSDHPQHH